jgi:hypothetical protein
VTHIGEKKGKIQSRRQQHTQAMRPGFEEMEVMMLRWQAGQMQLAGRRPKPGGNPSCWITTTTGGPPMLGRGIPGVAV